jgi:hypothetical protein
MVSLPARAFASMIAALREHIPLESAQIPFPGIESWVSFIVLTAKVAAPALVEKPDIASVIVIANTRKIKYRIRGPVLCDRLRFNIVKRSPLFGGFRVVRLAARFTMISAETCLFY